MPQQYFGGYCTVRTQGWFNTQKNKGVCSFNKPLQNTHLIRPMIPKNLTFTIPHEQDTFRVQVEGRGFRDATKQEIWEPYIGGLNHGIMFEEDAVAITLLPNFSIDVFSEITGHSQGVILEKIHRGWAKNKEKGKSIDTLIQNAIEGGWMDYDLLHDLTSIPVDEIKAKAVTHLLRR